jgi:hypothetical protein
MLAAQMAAVHNATMTFARRLNHVENIPQQDSAERASCRTRPCPSRRPSHRRKRHSRGRDNTKIRGSTLCSWICNGHGVASPELGAGRPASRPR